MHYFDAHTSPCLRFFLSLKHLGFVTYSVTLAPVWAEGPVWAEEAPIGAGASRLGALCAGGLPRLGWGLPSVQKVFRFGLRASRWANASRLG